MQNFEVVEFTNCEKLRSRGVTYFSLEAEFLFRLSNKIYTMMLARIFYCIVNIFTREIENNI